MKVKKKLNVSCEEFYDVLYESLKSEIELAIDKPINKIYKGFSYEKELATYAKYNRTAKVEITDLEENHKYAAKFSAGKDINTISFTITPHEKGCEIEYEEGYFNESGLRRTNFSIVSFLLTPYNKRRAKKKFKAMENYIIKNR